MEILCNDLLFFIYVLLSSTSYIFPFFSLIYEHIRNYRDLPICSYYPRYHFLLLSPLTLDLPTLSVCPSEGCKKPWKT